MPRTKRQNELINGWERKRRSIRLSKSIRVGNSRVRREVSPEIRSLQEGRIGLGSVAPLLSRRAKILAMQTYNHYSNDQNYNVPDKSDENSFLEGDYDEIYNYNGHHRSYDHHRAPFHVQRHYEDCKYELVLSSSFPLSIPTTRHFCTRSVLKPYRLRKSMATISVPHASKSVSSAKFKRSTARCDPKESNKKKKTVFKATQSGPITRSRRAALLDKDDD
uniref:Uncharacterized protein n=1 Tax=Onchocerca volvulus TaxID=6282 RepID=A0A8R1TX16_ONCVO